MERLIMFRSRLMTAVLNEVAYEAGSLGYSTQVFHNGDGYYVRAC